MLARLQLCPWPRRQHAFEQRAAGAARPASACLRARVTLPADLADQPNWQEMINSADRLPRICCAFRTCDGFEKADEDEAAQDEKKAEPFWDRVLKAHILRKHKNEIQNIALVEEEYVWDVYKEALAVQERRSVPAVGAAVDRRAFEATLGRYNDDNIQALI